VYLQIARKRLAFGEIEGGVFAVGGKKRSPYPPIKKQKGRKSRSYVVMGREGILGQNTFRVKDNLYT